jgi:hypothetical protein
MAMLLDSKGREIRQKLQKREKIAWFRKAAEAETKGYVSNASLVARDAQRAREHRERVRRELGLI